MFYVLAKLLNLPFHHQGWAKTRWDSAVDIHAQPSLKMKITPVKEELPEIKPKGSEVVIDHHKFPKAHKPNEGRSSKKYSG